MPKFRPIQNSFAAGVVTPLLDLRSDTPGYQQGCRELINVLPRSKGPAMGRPGFEHVETIPNVTFGRLFTFKIDDDDTYVVVVTTDQIYIADESGLQRGDNLIEDFDFQDPTQWDVLTGGGASSVNFSNGFCILTSGAQVTQFAGVSSIGPGGTGIVTATPANQHQLDLIKLEDDIVNITIGSTSGGNDIADVDLSGNVIQYDFVPGVSPFFITVNTMDANQVVTLDKLSAYDIITNPGAIQFASPYNETDIRELQVSMIPGSPEMLFVTRNVYPKILQYQAAGTLWFFQDFLIETETGLFPGPGTPPWGVTSNPGSLGFKDSRLWLGGTRDDPNTVWATAITAVAGLYRDFRVGTGLDDDAIEASRTQTGAIVWIAGGKEVFVGTTDGEDIYTHAGAAITPSDIGASRNSFEGGSRIQPFGLGAKLIFVSPQQDRVFSFDYERRVDGYKPADISYSAEHLFGQKQVLEVTGIKASDDFVVIPLTTGKVLLCVFNQNVNTIGWAVLETQGAILSTTDFVTSGEAQVAALTVRNNVLELERFRAKSEQFLDSFKTVISKVPTISFTGFDHLANQTVGVVADGWVQEDVTVGFDGSIVLQEPALKVTAGYHYTQRLKTLPYDSRDTGGSTRAKMKHHNKIFVAVLDSAEPKINGKRPPTRQLTTPMDTADPILEGTTYLNVANLGRDRFAQIEIEQDLPYPLTVLGIFTETDVTGL